MLRERNESGLSVKAWCAEHGISEHAYYYRLRQLRQMACNALEQAQPIQLAEVPLAPKQEEPHAKLRLTTKSGTLEIGEPEEAVTFDLSSLPAGTYTATCNATAPYAKTLSATFTISSAVPSLTHDVADGSGNPVCYLTVTVGDYNGDVSIQWPAGVTPDP